MNLIKIPFNGKSILVVQEGDKQRLIVKSLCEVLSLDDRAQRARIIRDPRLKDSWSKMNLVLPGSQGSREHMTIPRQKLAAFLYGLQPNMAKDGAIRANLIQFLEEMEEVIERWFEARMSGVSREEYARAVEEAKEAREAKRIALAQVSDLRRVVQEHAESLNEMRRMLGSGVIGEGVAQAAILGVLKQIALYESLDRECMPISHFRKRAEERLKKQVKHSRKWALLPRERLGEAQGFLDDMLQEAKRSAAERNRLRQTDMFGT